MRYVAAYLLGALTGKEPSSSDVEKILGSVGIEVDNDKLKKVFEELKGKNLEELMTEGRSKLASMPVGGGVAAAGAAAPAADASAAPAAESKKEEKKKEESESEDDDMGFGLFD